ncbi:MAG: ATP-binding protein [Mailhella sp.]
MHSSEQPAAKKSWGERFSPLGNLVSRIIPDSLLARLILIFSGSFFIMLLLTTIYAGESRHFYFIRGLMADRARRMAEVTVLLDATSPEIRFVLKEQFNSRGFFVTFTNSRPVLSVDDDELREVSSVMEYMLNFSLARLYGDTSIHLRGRRHADAWSQRDDIPRRGVLAIRELNIPSPLESIKKSVCQYFTNTKKQHRQSVYLATAILPLHDGTWIVIEDSAPGYPPMPYFPFTSIMAIEIFFIIISLIAFYLCVKPFRRLARAADRFGRDIMTPALPETGPTEVREAAQAFNRMQKSIRDFLEERERTLAAVSHDLRTPLTRMRLRVEQLDPAQRSALQKDIGELQQIMDTTIDIARSRNENIAIVDVMSLIESLVEDRQDMGQDIRLADHLQEPDALFSIPPLSARPLSMKRCISNLMDNAIRYGNHVIVDVKNSETMLSIIICDNGPGISEEELKKVFEPFYRVERSRNRSTGGTGLGLSIARSMARMHGGDVTLENRPEGGIKAIATFKRG